jgi:hypothetical protein
MTSVRLRETRIEVVEGDSFAVFHLSEPPTSAWIVRFEECLAKHSGVALVVIDQRVRTELPDPEDLPELRRFVQRCLEEANVGTSC